LTYTPRIDYDNAQQIVVIILTDFLDDVVNYGYCEDEAECIELASALVKVLKQFIVSEQIENGNDYEMNTLVSLADLVMLKEDLEDWIEQKNKERLG
jgi:hypothetical protein